MTTRSEASEAEKQIFKQARWLTQALILSGALNIGLILALFLVFVKDKIVPQVLDHRPAEQTAVSIAGIRNNADEILLLETLPFEQLFTKLDDKDLVEDGFSVRDLTLGVLVSKYHFNISKALPLKVLHPRVLALGNGSGLVALRIKVFPGLSDEDFGAAIHFAKLEKWPLTTEGLFLQIQQRKEEIEPSLLDAFYQSPEFVEVETLFQRVESSSDKKEILAILQSGDWQMLSNFAKSQKEAKDLTAARHQRFLLDYIGRNSKESAQVMLQTHGAFAVKKLDDAHAIAILQLLDVKNTYSEAFAKAMLISPRSDAVWRIAAKRLTQFAGEELQEPYDHMKVLGRFIPSDVLKNKVNVAKAVVNKTTLTPKPLTPSPKKDIKPLTHKVSEGETLWLIAKKYHVAIDQIKTLNKLTSDTIKPGKTLQIPGKK